MSAKVKIREAEFVTTFQEVDLSKVVVLAGRRTTGDVSSLAESIREIGLKQPIVVTPDYRLISGRRRLEAFRKLGRQNIPALIQSHDAISAELAEIDENLERNELNVLERYEHLARRKKLYEAKYPESRRGNSKVRASVKRNNLTLVDSFAKTAAKNLRIHPRTIQDAVKVVSDLPKDVRDQIRQTPIANSRKDLVKLAKHDPATQLKLVEQLAGMKANSVARAEEIVNGTAGKRLADPLAKLDSVLREVETVMRKAKQYGEFQNLFDNSNEIEKAKLLQRMEKIHDELGDYIGYLRRIAA